MMLRVCPGNVVLAAAFSWAVSAAAAAADQPSQVDFATQIAPILRESCLDCHGPTMQMAGLRLDRRALAFAGGDSGEPIQPGDGGASLLVQRLSDREQGILMPPSFSVLPGERSGLPQEQISLLKRWIDQGAAWPEELELTGESGPDDGAAEGKALFAAIRAGNRQRVERLLEDSSLLEAKDRDGSTPLMLAALYADVDLLRLIAERGADVNATNRNGVTALMWAAGDADKVRELLDRGAKVDARTAMGRTPLLIAATYAGNAETIRLLLDKGAPATDQDSMRETALTSAAKRGDARMVRMLIDAGADLKKGGRTPLVWAAQEGSVEALACLLECGAAEDKPSLNSALFGAAVRGSLEAVRLLLAAGADPNAAAGFAGYSPLMGAAYSESGGAEAVKLLLDRGADVKLKGANGETALSLARKHGRTAVVELLEKAGAKE